jgi:predicted ribosome quality control (RQC) complex YloA/Tae2 family protein
MKYFSLFKIEFLHETNRALERRLQELTDLKRDLSNKQFEERLKNDDLLRDLKDIDRLARKVQADKQYTVEAADRELTEAKVSFERKKFSFSIHFISDGNRT